MSCKSWKNNCFVHFFKSQNTKQRLKLEGGEGGVAHLGDAAPHLRALTTHSEVIVAELGDMVTPSMS